MSKSDIHFEGNRIQSTPELRKVLKELCNEVNFTGEDFEVEPPSKHWVFRFYRR